MADTLRNPRVAAGRRTAMVRRLVKAHAETTAADLAAGIRWYDRARAAAVEMDPENVARGAGVIAALSPRNGWAQNVAQAARMLEAADAGEDCPAMSTLSNRAKAWRIANGETPLDVLGGPKVRAFFANIMGDTDAVCVDVWAARAAEGRDDPNAPNGARYALIQDAYRRAATILGMAPRDLQAAVWIHVRGAAD